MCWGFFLFIPVSGKNICHPLLQYFQSHVWSRKFLYIERSKGKVIWSLVKSIWIKKHVHNVSQSWNFEMKGVYACFTEHFLALQNFIDWFYKYKYVLLLSLFLYSFYFCLSLYLIKFILLFYHNLWLQLDFIKLCDTSLTTEIFIWVVNLLRQ